jgi:hypothetical protein
MGNVIAVRARVELLLAVISGKTNGYKSGVRPNHMFSGQSSAIAGALTFEGREWLELGESCTAVVTFVYPSEFPPLLPGVTWRIHEGSRHVGNGSVLEVLNAG